MHAHIILRLLRYIFGNVREVSVPAIKLQLGRGMMVKKVILLLLSVMLACSALLSACVNSPEQVNSYMNPIPYDYPVKPGTEEWNSLSMADKIALSYVDESTVENMTTEAVLVTTLNYPFIVNIFAYGKIDEGIRVVQGYCSPLAELLERENAVQAICSYLDEKEDTESAEYIVADNLREYIQNFKSA